MEKWRGNGLTSKPSEFAFWIAFSCHGDSAPRRLILAHSLQLDRMRETTTYGGGGVDGCMDIERE